MSGYVDLHVHTTYSDGSLPPAEVVRRAAQAGLAAVAICDHDGVDGNAEAFAAGASYGVEIITGVEISASFSPENIHMVGLFIDPTECRLVEALREVREYRRRRNPKILEKLRELGVPVAMSEVEEVARGATIGRPHIAEVMVRKGYVADFAEAFDKYLGHGKPAYVSRKRITAEEAIALIHGAGGLAFVAHPGLIAVAPRILEGMIYKLARFGLDGIEAHYTDHLPADTSFLLRLCEEYDLLASGGTDFHGAAKPGVELGVGRGGLRVPYELVARMKGRLSARARSSASL